MSRRLLSARRFRPSGEQKAEPVHPSIGLPADAPDQLETPNGSFVRVLPESEHIPLDGKARSWDRLGHRIFVVFLLILAAMCAVTFLLARIGASDDIIGIFVVSAIIGDTLLLVSILFLAPLEPRHRALSMPKLLNCRRARIFEPGDVSGIMSFRHGDAREAYKDPDDFVLFRIGDGFLEFELSRAQVRIAADDLAMFATDEPVPALVIQAWFGGLRWAIAARYVAFFEWGGPWKKIQLMLQYRRFADMIPERLAAVPDALTATGSTEAKEAEWEPFTVETGDSTIRVSPDGIDVSTPGVHHFFLGWDQIDGVRWRERDKLVISGAGRKLTVPESALNTYERVCIKTCLVRLDVSVREKWPVFTIVFIYIYVMFFGFLFHKGGVPMIYLILPGGGLLVGGTIYYIVNRKYGATRFYRSKPMEIDR